MKALYFLMVASILGCQPHKINQASGPKARNNIINGVPISSDQDIAKWTVSIGDGQISICTGVIVTQNTIVTAGHCIASLGYEKKVSFGLLHTIDSYKLDIVAIKLHEEYQQSKPLKISTGINDLALLKLQGEIPPEFEPAQIAPPDLILNSGEEVALAGYGKTEMKISDNLLRTTLVQLLEIGEFEFSTNETTSGSCQGDSGGPVFLVKNHNKYLIGITSRGDEKCGELGIYTNITKYINWIKSPF